MTSLSSQSFRRIKVLLGGQVLHLINSSLSDEGSYSCSAADPLSPGMYITSVNNIALQMIQINSSGKSTRDLYRMLCCSSRSCSTVHVSLFMLQFHCSCPSFHVPVVLFTLFEWLNEFESCCRFWYELDPSPCDLFGIKLFKAHVEHFGDYGHSHHISYL